MTRLRIRTILIAILVLLIPIAAHQLWDYIELRRLIAEIESVIAKGEPVTEAQGFARWSFNAWTSHDRDAGAYYIAAGMVTRHTRPDPVFPVLEWLAGAAPQPAEDVVRWLHTYADQSREALTLADRGAALRFSRLPPGTEYSFRTSHVVGLARLLTARTLSLSWTDDGDAAVASAISALKLRRAFREIRWPFLYAVNHETPAILGLSHPSPAALLELQRALESEDARDDVLEGLLSDRARAIESVWHQYYGPDAAAPRDYRLPTRSVMRTARRPLTTHKAVRMLRLWAKLIDAAHKPWPDRIQAVQAVAARNRPPSDSPEEHMFLFPPYEVVTARTIVNDRSSMTAVAIERFRRDNSGALPLTLAELAPRYLASVPADPYSGRSLLYVRDDVAYTIHSVGPNGADDRGDLISEHQAAQKRGYGPRPLRGRDMGVRVLIRR